MSILRKGTWAELVAWNSLYIVLARGPSWEVYRLRESNLTKQQPCDFAKPYKCQVKRRQQTDLLGKALLYMIEPLGCLQQCLQPQRCY
eukprot:scaffold18198_cov22-Tisochrysis_lutea.AAC.2